MLAADTRWGIGDFARSLARDLAGAGIAEPAREARRVLKLAGVTPEAIIAHPERCLSRGQSETLGRILRRRLAGEPLSRIEGERDFYGRLFHLSRATLDPRPESEVLIGAALEVVGEEGWRDQPPRILDVGTGSGCLLVTLLAELPLATGIGTDISAGALIAAEANARRHGVLARARFARRPSLEGAVEAVDLLVCNPPYIPAHHIAGLPPEVRDWDPRAALDGGSDGLQVYREIAVRLAGAVPNGWALFEVAAGHAREVQAVLASSVGASMATKRSWPDLLGHTRCVAVRTRHKHPPGKTLSFASQPR